jgi:hypothetical protein
MGKIEATTDRTALSCPVKARISFPVAASHRRAVLSSEQVSTDLPSGLKAKDNRTALSCPVKARIAFPVAASHRRAVLSHDPVSTRAPSGLKPRRVVAKVEWHSGELYPRVGFIVTNMARRGCPLFFLPLGLLQRCTGLIIICLNAKIAGDRALCQRFLAARGALARCGAAGKVSTCILLLRGISKRLLLAAAPFLKKRRPAQHPWSNRL